jgi:hypothetical protein
MIQIFYIIESFSNKLIKVIYIDLKLNHLLNKGFILKGFLKRLLVDVPPSYPVLFRFLLFYKLSSLNLIIILPKFFEVFRGLLSFININLET